MSGLINPFLPWFAITDVAIAAVAALLVVGAAKTFRDRPLSSPPFVGHVLLCGVVIGIVSAVVSVPVVVYLFGGVTGSGSALVVAVFLKAGQHLMSAAMLSGLASDPPDKIAPGAVRRPALSRDAGRVHRHAAHQGARADAMTPNGAFTLGFILIALGMGVPGPRGVAVLVALTLAFARDRGARRERDRAQARRRGGAAARRLHGRGVGRHRRRVARPDRRRHRPARARPRSPTWRRCAAGCSSSWR